MDASPPDTIAAVVVTHDRLELLKEVLAGLRAQTRPLDAVFVIDNASGDGTAEWLASRTDLIHVRQGNVGGAGGFATGIERAFEGGYDWIWVMDDDVKPEVDALERLSSGARLSEALFAVPAKRRPEEGRLDRDAGQFVLEGEDWLAWQDANDTDLPRVSYFTFEGPLISREYVRRVGFPDASYFISGDDTEYALRGFMTFEEHVGVFVDDAVMRRLVSTGPGPAPLSRRLFRLRNSVRMWRRHGVPRHARALRRRLRGEVLTGMKECVLHPGRRSAVRALACLEALVTTRLNGGPWFLVPKNWGKIDG